MNFKERTDEYKEAEKSKGFVAVRITRKKRVLLSVFTHNAPADAAVDKTAGH